MELIEREKREREFIREMSMTSILSHFIYIYLIVVGGHLYKDTYILIPLPMLCISEFVRMMVNT